MKRSNLKRRKNYHAYILESEKKQVEVKEKAKVKRHIKEATNDLANSLSLEDDVKMSTNGVSKIISRRAHESAMKKKRRKWKKEPIPIDTMQMD